jgi:hypothetical protein
MMVNAVFGFPTFIAIKNQRLIAVAILLYYIAYLSLLSLTYERLLNEKNFNPPLLRYFPSFIRLRVLFLKKVKKVDKIRPSFIDKFSLFSKYPLTPPVVHRFFNKIWPSFWLMVFSGLGKVLFFVVLFLLALLTINLEGIMGYPLLTEGWAEWFTQYNHSVTKVRLLK